MGQAQGTLERSVDDAIAAAQRTAAAQGYAPAEGQGGPYTLVFRKGGDSAFSRGSELTVQLAESSPSATRVTVSAEEKWAITDWGRSGRRARRFLEEMGASR
jgi:hypothetical protein